jgi:hypothetical protein
MEELVFIDKSEIESPVYSTDLYYDLFEGGYIKPEDMLEDPQQIADIYDAMNLIQMFLQGAQEHGHISEED